MRALPHPTQFFYADTKATLRVSKCITWYNLRFSSILFSWLKWEKTKSLRMCFVFLVENADGSFHKISRTGNERTLYRLQVCAVTWKSSLTNRKNVDMVAEANISISPLSCTQKSSLHVGHGFCHSVTCTLSQNRLFLLFLDIYV